MIFKWVRELVAKYSFITGCEMKSGYVLIWYKVGEESKFKKLPLRANKERLESVIRTIKEETDYKNKKKMVEIKIRKKPVMVFS